MYIYGLTLHVIAVMLVVGTLFVQSLTVVFRLRLSDPASGSGFRSLFGRDSGADQYTGQRLAAHENHTFTDPDCFRFCERTSN